MTQVDLALDIRGRKSYAQLKTNIAMHLPRHRLGRSIWSQTVKNACITVNTLDCKDCSSKDLELQDSQPKGANNTGVYDQL